MNQHSISKKLAVLTSFSPQRGEGLMMRGGLVQGLSKNSSFSSSSSSSSSPQANPTLANRPYAETMCLGVWGLKLGGSLDVVGRPSFGSWFLDVFHVCGKGARASWSPHRPSILALLTCLLLLTLNSSRADTTNSFTHGIDLSRAGQFPEAAAAFENSAKTQLAAGTLLNLGLAEWQRGRAGAAILAWEQARWIDPFDSRVAANLKFARQAAQVDEPQLKWHEAVSTWLSPTAWAWLTGITLWLGVGLLVLPGIFRRRKAGWHQLLAAMAFGIFLLSLAANFGVMSRSQIGFVVKKNASLQLTPTHNGEVISTLAAGEPARKIRTRGNYVFIRTLGASGWVEKDNFQLISAPSP